MLRYSALPLLLLVGPLVGAVRADVILQFFECRWETIERRMPDVFAVGYDAFWLPPPGRADTGGGSVGYDVYDRFNLGTPAAPTGYGTTKKFSALVESSHDAGVSVFVDLILNHNGFRDHNTPGFEAAGGYPGFAVTLPGDPYGDFHNPTDTGRYNERISGLIDIAQEKNHQYIRHPVTAGPQNLPNKTPLASNAALYPDQALPANSIGVRPFNLANPLAGDPYLENATGVLLRHTQWMVDVMRVDGFRIDAQKHIPEWFFDSFYDAVLWERGRPLADGTPTTPFSFGEVFDGGFPMLTGYIRKDGFGNRDVLDFPLFFSFTAQLNGTGLGSWANIVNASIDASDGNANDGTRGVMFVQSHDSFGPADDNLAYAYILTRPGYPLVYFNAGEFGSRPFPKDGRGDALGGVFGDIITRLVDVHNEYVRGVYLERSRDADVLVYERDNNLIVGLNDNRDITVTRFDERNVLTNFDGGTRLVELTGNAANPSVDPLNQIPETVIVGGDKRVTIRVPRNSGGRGYVMYGPRNPDGTLTVSPVASVIAADPPSVPAKLRRYTAVPVITDDFFNVNLQTFAGDPLDPDTDDNAIFRINRGGDFNGNGGIDITSGEFQGYEQFVTTRSPLYGGGTGTYVQTIDADDLAEGYNFVRVIAFRHRDDGGAIYETFPQTIYLDRAPPAAELAAPTGTITTRQFPVVVRGLDKTVTRVHVIVDQGAGADVLPLVSGANQATRIDTDEFRWVWDVIWSGNHTLAIVAFEDSGNYATYEYVNVQARNGFARGPGDMNLDGLVNFNDIDPFILAIVAGDFNAQADTSGDGLVNFDDIDGFINCIVTICP